MCQWKNFENWSISGGHVDESLRLTFLGHPVEREYDVICDLSNGVICIDFEWPLTRVSSFQRRISIKKTMHYYKR